VPTVIYTSREEIEVKRFSALTIVGVSLLAIFLQAFLPLRLPFLSFFDLPLIVTIFFSVGRRNPIYGLLTGATIGILQDALTGQVICVFGIAKTVVGYAASSLGVRIDVENPGTRFLMIFGCSLMQSILYLIIIRSMIRSDEAWHFFHETGRALANALLGVVMFALLDRLQSQR
jgi:rod shape-determining protein MreD